MEMWHVYIVECADGTLYTGIAKDVGKRIAQHNAGKTGAKYVRGRRPVKLLRSWSAGDKSAALKQEYEVKKWPRSKKLASKINRFSDPQPKPRPV